MVQRDKMPWIAAFLWKNELDGFESVPRDHDRVQVRLDECDLESLGGWSTCCGGWRMDEVKVRRNGANPEGDLSRGNE